MNIFLHKNTTSMIEAVLSAVPLYMHTHTIKGLQLITDNGCYRAQLNDCLTEPAPGCTSLILSQRMLSADDILSLLLLYELLFRSLLFLFEYVFYIILCKVVDFVNIIFLYGLECVESYGYERLLC